MQELTLSGCNLTGTLPPEWATGRFEWASYIDLHDNALVSPVLLRTGLMQRACGPWCDCTAAVPLVWGLAVLPAKPFAIANDGMQGSGASVLGWEGEGP